MTQQQYESLPFIQGVHLAMADLYSQTYYNTQYDMAIAFYTRRDEYGYAKGRTWHNWFIGDKRYRSAKKFLEALEKVEWKGIA